MAEVVAESRALVSTTNRTSAHVNCVSENEATVSPAAEAEVTEQLLGHSAPKRTHSLSVLSCVGCPSLRILCLLSSQSLQFAHLNVRVPHDPLLYLTSLSFTYYDV